MKLSRLIEGLPVKDVLSPGDPEVTSVTMDSRQVQGDALFICVKGEANDGHRFAADAVKKGAKAVVAERPLDVDVPVVLVSDARRALAVLADRFYGHPTHQLSLIGVTGTNGKTTVTRLIQQIQEMNGLPTGRIGTLGIQFKDYEEAAANTTPDAVTLQRAFKTMVERGARSAVMEVSSHALVQGRVRGCDYNIAVFTNLTQDHLDYHQTMERYLHAKSLLFSQLGNTYDRDRLKAAVLNADDDASAQLAQMTAASVWTYGIEREADFMAENIRVTAGKTSFDFITPKGTYPVEMKLVGKFNVYNALAAALACYINGVALEDVVRSIGRLEGVSGRLETVDAGQNFAVIVDYSHTPDSLKNALTTIREFAKKRIITVIGCGGDRDRTKRPLMARVAVEHSDVAIFTSDNPRTEDPVRILRDMEAGVPAGSYETIVDRREAIFRAIALAEPDDVVLLAGKGHETYMIIGREVIHFDDRLVAREAIKERLQHERRQG
jgi:UDP-N-acetylmuramoyl-L-alanyl-D-glutamate--2,6-diaminopimelate ligase